MKIFDIEQQYKFLERVRKLYLARNIKKGNRSSERTTYVYT